jgi:hypothetical protein
VAVEEVVQAMIELRDEQQDPRRHVRVVQRPLHAEASRDRLEGGRERRGVGRAGEAVERHAHHEPAGVDVAELRGLDDVAAVFREARADGPDDPGLVGAGKREDEALKGHGQTHLTAILKRRSHDKLPRMPAAVSLIPRRRRWHANAFCPTIDP